MNNLTHIPTDLYYQYNPWWEEGCDFSGLIQRERFEQQLSRVLKDRSIVFITGLRRVGKTSLIKRTIQQLIEQKVKARHIFYISLDDYLIKDESILEIIDDYRLIHKITASTKVYIFLDEITYKKDFQIQLKNLYDSRNVKIFASSSSSSALRDNQGFLTGRRRVIEVTPLNFDEYLIFKNKKIKKADLMLRKSYFEDYLEVGGMPEYVLNQDREYLTNLVSDILHKDIVAFHGLKNPQLIEDYFKLLMERVGKEIAINKIAKILKISPDTAKRYLVMFEETYLIYLVPRYGKTNETILNPKKVYAADSGIRNLFTGFRDKGALFENYIFLNIKGLRPKYFKQEGIEIDFMTENKWLIEVKYGSKMNAKQKALFTETKANKRIYIKSYEDVESLERLTKLS